MTIEELKVVLENKKGFTDEEFKDTLLFFSSEVEMNCENINLFFDFAKYAISTNTIYNRLEGIHEITKKILEQKKDCPSIWKLELLEIFYFYFVDSLAEVLKHANRILMLSSDDVDKCGAYSFAILVFLRHQMYNEAISYIDEADIYIKNHEVEKTSLFQILVNELDIYALCDQPKKFIATLDRLDNLMQESLSCPHYDRVNDYYTLHVLFGKVMLRNHFEIDKEKIAIDFKKHLSSLRRWKMIGENYGSLLIPLFDFFKDAFDKDEFVDEILNVITYNMNVNERLVLFNYLFDDLKLDKSKYHDVYADYVKNLTRYYNNSQRNKSSEILTEILNFSLEKKLDVLNAKYHYDTLTGCYNRVFLSEIEERMLEAGDVVIYLDLNDFKKINDTYGHDTGDKQLKIFAEILMRHFENDVVLRLGGDEFVVLTRGLPEDVLAKLDSARAEYLTHNLLKNRYGFSAGVLIPHGMVVHEAIGEADKAMYDSKKTGLPCIIREV